MATIRKGAAAPLPEVISKGEGVVQTALPAQSYPSVQTRLYNPETKCTLQLSWPFTLLEEVEIQIAILLEQGYLPCQSPDAPREPQRENPPPRVADSGAEDYARPGRREYTPKEERLVVPFGKYRGDRLDQIETHDPSYIDYLADKAQMADIRRAAQKLVNQRPRRQEDLPF